jgi:hypothetical protein
LALPYVSDEHLRGRIADQLGAARGWALGERTAEEVKKAYAYAAAYADEADAYADYAANIAATAADDEAAAVVARSAVLRQCADIVRRHYPAPPALSVHS